jgi:hypothetical protein
VQSCVDSLDISLHFEQSRRSGRSGRSRRALVPHTFFSFSFFRFSFFARTTCIVAYISSLASTTMHFMKRDGSRKHGFFSLFAPSFGEDSTIRTISKNIQPRGKAIKWPLCDLLYLYI